MSTTEHQPESEVESPEVHFEPLVQLPLLKVGNIEEGEEELFQMRAKLFRFDKSRDPPEWKERGTGTVKLLKNQESEMIRVVMRRDKTFKTCANHYVQPEMELKPNCGSDKAWVWTTPADYADGEAKPEMLAIRFANPENAQKFKAKFIEAQKMMEETIPKHNKSLQNNGLADSAEDTKTTETASGDGGKSEEKTATNSEEAKDVTDKLESLTVKDSESKDSVENSVENSKDSTDKEKDTEEKKD